MELTLLLIWDVPRSWSQVALTKIPASGIVIGVDLLEIQPLSGT